MTYRVGIIGCGRMAGTIDDEITWSHPDFQLPYGHAGAYKAVPETEIVAAADINGEQLEHWCDRFDIPGRYTDYREMIQKENLDIVSVTVPALYRAEPLLYAAENGVRGIYSEKALCASPAETDAIVEACTKNNVQIVYGAMRRYWTGVEKAREIIESGDIGSPRAVLFGATNVFHTGSHFVDVGLYLLGDAKATHVQANLRSPKIVEADGSVRVENDPGVISAVVQLENGTRMLFTDLYYGEAEITCTEGLIRSTGDFAQYSVRRAIGGKSRQLEDLEFPAFQGRSSTVAIIRDLIRSIETGQPGRSNIDVIQNGMELSFAMVESHLRGGVPVEVPIENRSLWVNSK